MSAWRRLVAYRYDLQENYYLYHFDALCSESLSGWLGHIASYTTEFELVGEDGVGEDGFDDGAALVACGAKDREDFRHCGCCELERL